MPKQYSTTGPRSLWPSVATSGPVAGCTVEAQLLFDRLIAAADDMGRMKGDPRLVAAACMPLVARATPRNVERWLAELAGQRLVIRYESDGETLLQLRGWWDHQRGQRWVYPSKWPPPEGWTDPDPRTPTGDKPPGAASMAPASRGHDAGMTPASACASASAGANASAGARAPAPAAPEDTPTVASPPPTDAYRVYQALTGQQPSTTQKKWIDDLCRQHGGRDVVIDAMQAEPDPHEYGFLGRITDRLRGKPAVPARGRGYRHPPGHYDAVVISDDDLAADEGGSR